MKFPTYLLRYIVEAILIFGSVYGAFLLEDYRSISERKNEFVKRWESMIKSLSTDSVRISTVLYGARDDAMLENLGLHRWQMEDSIFLANYDHYIESNNLQPVIASVGAQHYWAMSYTDPAPYYQDILENHPDLYLSVCEADPRICEWLDIYSQLHKTIDRLNRFAREMHISYWGKILDSYRAPEIARSDADILAIASDVLSVNHVQARYTHHKNVTVPTLDYMLKLNIEMTPVLKEFRLSSVGIE